MFTLSLDYDQIIIKLNMYWVHINYLQSLIVIGLQLLQTTLLGLFELLQTTLLGLFEVIEQNGGHMVL